MAQSGRKHSAYGWSLTDIANTFGLDRSKLDAYARKSGIKQQMLKISGTYYADDALAEELVRLFTNSFDIERLRKSTIAKPSRKKPRLEYKDETPGHVVHEDESVVEPCGHLNKDEVSGLLEILSKSPSPKEAACREEVESAIDRAADDLDEAEIALDYARTAVDKLHRSVLRAANLAHSNDGPYIPSNVEQLADLSACRDEIELQLADLEAKTIRLQLLLSKLDCDEPAT